MTNEEAIKDFQSDIEFCKESAFTEEYAKDIEADLVAIKAIEKQIPVSPTGGGNTRWHCPICDNWIAERQYFCDKCGQAIDWEVLKKC